MALESGNYISPLAFHHVLPKNDNEISNHLAAASHLLPLPRTSDQVWLALMHKQLLMNLTMITFPSVSLSVMSCQAWALFV